MKQPHPQPRRSALGIGLSLLIVLVTGGIVVWQLADYVIVLSDRLAPPAAPAPGAAPIGDETAGAD